MQTRESGSAANDYGRYASRLLAGSIGATPASNASNEFNFRGDRITIRCGRANTKSVGVTFKMLDYKRRSNNRPRSAA
jgi:hypothetical protein